MGLEIGWRGGFQRAFAVDQDWRRRPSCSRPDAVRLLERGEKRVAKKWIIIGECIPLPRVDIGDTAPEAGNILRFAIGHAEALSRTAMN